MARAAPSIPKARPVSGTVLRLLAVLGSLRQRPPPPSPSACVTRVWNELRKYLPKFAKFEGVIMPDLSTCIYFPRPLKLWNAYRNQLLGAWFQRQGLVTLPNARLQPGCDWLIEGLPKRSVIAICGRALAKDVTKRRRFVRDVRITVDALNPMAIFGEVIGTWVSPDASQRLPTTRGTIRYGKHGAHIVPSGPRED